MPDSFIGYSFLAFFVVGTMGGWWFIISLALKSRSALEDEESDEPKRFDPLPLDAAYGDVPNIPKYHPARKAGV